MMKSFIRSAFKTRFSLKSLSRPFSTQVTFKFPDEILSNLKDALEAKKDIKDLEEDIVSNIHFFDSEQYTDVVSLLGKHNKGSQDIWDLLERKAYDYELNFIQARDIFNSVVKGSKASNDIEVKLTRELSKTSGLNTAEKETYALFF